MRDEYVLDLWSRVKFNFFFVLGIIISVTALRLFLNVSTLFIFFFLGVSFSVKLFLFNDFNWRSHLKSWAFLLVVFVVINLTSAWLGWWGIIIIILIILVYKFYKGWDLFMKSVRKIEIILFGKPLDKKEFQNKDKPSMYKEKKLNEEEE